MALIDDLKDLAVRMRDVCDETSLSWARSVDEIIEEHEKPADTDEPLLDLDQIETTARGVVGGLMNFNFPQIEAAEITLRLVSEIRALRAALSMILDKARMAESLLK
jgi:hypothetical protein